MKNIIQKSLLLLAALPLLAACNTSSNSTEPEIEEHEPSLEIDVESIEIEKFGASLDISDVEQLSTIKNLKLNTTGGVRATNINLKVKEVEDDSELESISGKLYIKYGFDGAMLFDVSDAEGTEYNGVVKVSVNIQSNSTLSKEGLEAVSELLNKKNPTDAEIDKLPLKIQVTIAVYDVEGNKLFDYFTANKLSEVINFGKEF